MNDKVDTKKWEKIGLRFQQTLIVTFLWRTWQFETIESLPIRLMSIIGAGAFGWCLYRLYVKKGRTTGLITTGLFRFTRHPMYTGIILMDATRWFGDATRWSNPVFLGTLVVFLSAVVIAAWIQEQETLARFGEAAREYYARTPRLFLLYPWYRLTHR